MTFKTAKRLKEAGFEVKIKNESWFKNRKGSQPTVSGFINIICEKHGVDECKTPDTCELVEVPTLEELIEACGDGFLRLEKSKDKWIVSGTQNDGFLQFSLFSRDEAVAELLITLNAK